MVQSHQVRRSGRLPRAYDPAIPHISALMTAVRNPAPIPDSVHWALDLGITDFGMMLNDRLGLCTLAAAYHMGQIWSAHGRKQVLTEPDQYVEQAYREFAGYDGTPATDNGAVEQDILRQWLARGLPIREGTAEDPAPGRSRLLFYGEIDVRNLDDVRRAINDCGGAYIGFDVPAWLMQEATLPDVWDRRASGEGSAGGHAVCLTGYDRHGGTFDLISWGAMYRMTEAFFRRFVDEAYAISHPWWVDATGRTPLGLDVSMLEAQMPGHIHTRADGAAGAPGSHR